MQKLPYYNNVETASKHERLRAIILRTARSTRIRFRLKMLKFFSGSKKFFCPHVLNRICLSTRIRLRLKTQVFFLSFLPAVQPYPMKTVSEHGTLSKTLNLTSWCHRYKMFRFQESTREHENCVFRNFHSGERFWKFAFSVTVFNWYMNVDGRPIHKEKVAFSNKNWTFPL